MLLIHKKAKITVFTFTQNSRALKTRFLELNNSHKLIRTSIVCSCFIRVFSASVPIARPSSIQDIRQMSITNNYLGCLIIIAICICICYFWVFTR